MRDKLQAVADRDLVTEDLGAAAHHHGQPPELAGVRLPAQDHRTADLGRPRRLEGDRVAVHDGEEVRIHRIRQLMSQRADGVPGLDHIAVRVGHTAGCTAQEVQRPGLPRHHGQHLQRRLRPFRLVQDLMEILGRTAADQHVAQAAHVRRHLEGRPRQGPDADLAVAHDVDKGLGRIEGAGHRVGIDRRRQLPPNLRQGPAVRRHRHAEHRPAHVQRPRLALHGGAGQAHHGLGPAQVRIRHDAVGLLGRAAEPHPIAQAGQRDARDRQVDIEGLVVPERQQFVGDRLHVQEGADRGAVEEGELEGEVVHPRIEPRPLADQGVKVEGLAVDQDGQAAQVNNGVVEVAVWLPLVGFLGQPERIVQEPLLAHQRPTLNRQRTPDRVDPLLEGREHERIAAVHKTVVDRLQGDRLREVPFAELRHPIPIVRPEHDLGRDRRGAAGIRADQNLGANRPRRRLVRMRNGQDPTALHQIVTGPEGEVLRQTRRNRGQGVAELGRVSGRGHPAYPQRPGLTRRREAGQFHRDRVRVVAGIRGHLHREPAARIRGHEERRVKRRAGVRQQQLGRLPLRELPRRPRGQRHREGRARPVRAGRGPRHHQGVVLALARAQRRHVAVGRIRIDGRRQGLRHLAQGLAHRDGVAEGGHARQGHRPRLPHHRQPAQYRRPPRNQRGLIARPGAVDLRLEARHHIAQGGPRPGEVAEGPIARVGVVQGVVVRQIGSHLLQNRVHPQGRVQTRQRQHPVLTRGGRPAELHQGLPRRRPDLHLVGLAKGRVRIEGLVGVVGPRRHRQHVHHHRRGRRRRQHHHITVGHRRLDQLGRIARRIRLQGQQTADLVAGPIVRNPRHRPGAGRIHRVLLVLGLVAQDLTRQAQAVPLRHREDLVVEVEEVGVALMPRQRGDQVVVQPRIHPPERHRRRRVEEPEDVVVDEDREHPQRVGARRAGCERILDERIVVCRTAEIRSPAAEVRLLVAQLGPVRDPIVVPRHHRPAAVQQLQPQRDRIERRHENVRPVDVEHARNRTPTLQRHHHRIQSPVPVPARRHIVPILNLQRHDLAHLGHRREQLRMPEGEPCRQLRGNEVKVPQAGVVGVLIPYLVGGRDPIHRQRPHLARQPTRRVLLDGAVERVLRPQVELGRIPQPVHRLRLGRVAVPKQADQAQVAQAQHASTGLLHDHRAAHHVHLMNRLRVDRLRQARRHRGFAIIPRRVVNRLPAERNPPDVPGMIPVGAVRLHHHLPVERRRAAHRRGPADGRRRDASVRSQPIGASLVNVEGVVGLRGRRQEGRVPTRPAVQVACPIPGHRAQRRIRILRHAVLRRLTGQRQAPSLEFGDAAAQHHLRPPGLGRRQGLHRVVVRLGDRDRRRIRAPVPEHHQYRAVAHREIPRTDRDRVAIDLGRQGQRHRRRRRPRPDRDLHRPTRAHAREADRPLLCRRDVARHHREDRRARRGRRHAPRARQLRHIQVDRRIRQRGEDERGPAARRAEERAQRARDALGRRTHSRRNRMGHASHPQRPHLVLVDRPHQRDGRVGPSDVLDLGRQVGRDRLPRRRALKLHRSLRVHPADRHRAEAEGPGAADRDDRVAIDVAVVAIDQRLEAVRHHDRRGRIPARAHRVGVGTRLGPAADHHRPHVPSHGRALHRDGGGLEGHQGRAILAIGPRPALHRADKPAHVLGQIRLRRVNRSADPVEVEPARIDDLQLHPAGVGHVDGGEAKTRGWVDRRVSGIGQDPALERVGHFQQGVHHRRRGRPVAIHVDRVGVAHGDRVVLVAQPQRPDVARAQTPVERILDAGVEGVRIAIGHPRAVRLRRRRGQHVARNLESIQIHAPVPSPLHADVGHPEVDRAAVLGVAHLGIEEGEEVARRVDVLAAAAVVAELALGHRLRRKEEGALVMVLDRDLQVVVRPHRHPVPVRIRRGHLQIIGPLLLEIVLQVIVEVERGAAIPPILARARIVLGPFQARIPLRDQRRQRRLLRVERLPQRVKPQPAHPHHRIPQLEPAVDIEDRPQAREVLRGPAQQRVLPIVQGILQHRLRDLERVEVRPTVPGPLHRQVRQSRRRGDVRTRIRIPLGRIQILRNEDGVVDAHFLDHGRAEVADQLDVVRNLRRIARIDDVEEEAEALLVAALDPQDAVGRILRRIAVLAFNGAPQGLGNAGPRLVGRHGHGLGQLLIAPDQLHRPPLARLRVEEVGVQIQPRARILREVARSQQHFLRRLDQLRAPTRVDHQHPRRVVVQNPHIQRPRPRDVAVRPRRVNIRGQLVHARLVRREVAPDRQRPGTAMDDGQAVLGQAEHALGPVRRAGRAGHRPTRPRRVRVGSRGQPTHRGRERPPLPLHHRQAGTPRRTGNLDATQHIHPGHRRPDGERRCPGDHDHGRIERIHRRVHLRQRVEQRGHRRRHFRQPLARLRGVTDGGGAVDRDTPLIVLGARTGQRQPRGRILGQITPTLVDRARQPIRNRRKRLRRSAHLLHRVAVFLAVERDHPHRPDGVRAGQRERGQIPGRLAQTVVPRHRRTHPTEAAAIGHVAIDGHAGGERNAVRDAQARTGHRHRVAIRLGPFRQRHRHRGRILVQGDLVGVTGPVQNQAPGGIEHRGAIQGHGRGRRSIHHHLGVGHARSRHRKAGVKERRAGDLQHIKPGPRHRGRELRLRIDQRRQPRRHLRQRRPMPRAVNKGLAIQGQCPVLSHRRRARQFEGRRPIRRAQIQLEGRPRDHHIAGRSGHRGDARAAVDAVFRHARHPRRLDVQTDREQARTREPDGVRIARLDGRRDPRHGRGLGPQRGRDLRQRLPRRREVRLEIDPIDGQRPQIAAPDVPHHLHQGLQVGHLRLARLAAVLVDLAHQPAGHVFHRHAQEIVNVARRNRMRDARIVRRLLVAVRQGRHRHRLGHVPIRRRELDKRPRQAHLAVRIPQVHTHRPRRRLGQNDVVEVRLEVHRGVRVLRHHRVVAVRYRVRTGVPRDDQHLGRIIVHDLDADPERGQPVIGAAVLRARPLDHVVLDVDRAPALRQQIVRRRHRHRLRDEPVAAREEQAHAHFAAVQRQALAARGPFPLENRHREGRHQHVLLGRLRQHDHVGVYHQPRVRHRILEHPQRSVRQRHHNPGLVVVTHIRHHVPRVDRPVSRIRTVHGLNHQPAMALEAVAHHRDRVAPAPAHMERVAPKTAHNLHRHLVARALDEEAVVPFDRIHNQPLQTGVGDVEAGAEDPAVVHHKVVPELRPHDGQRVEPVAAVDPHRRVHRVGDEVGALPAVDVRVGRLRIVRIHLDEGPHQEGVVVLVAKEEDLRLVAVNREGVVANAPEHRRALAHPVAQEPAGHLRGLEVILLRQTIVRIGAVPRAQEHLPHLEGVVARIAVNHHRREVVIEHKGVVARPAVYLNRPVNVAVVVDPLDHPALHRHPVLVDLDRRHHPPAHVAVRPNEEEVRLLRAEDPQPINARIALGLVEHVDPGGDPAGQADLVKVAALLPVQRQDPVDPAHERLPPVAIEVHPDDVVAAARVDGGGPCNRVDVDDVILAVDDRQLVARIEEGDSGVGRADVERVIGVVQPDLQHLEPFIPNAQRHAQPRELRARQLPALANAGRVARIVDPQFVGLAPAGGQGEAPADQRTVGVVEGAGEGVGQARGLPEAPCRAAHPNQVAACARVDRGRPRHSLNVVQISATLAGDMRD